MKIFIFEPYEWDYCGGAIIAIASSYEEAVYIIVEDANPMWDLKKEYFAKDESEFENVDRDWNTWLLTHVIETTEEKPRLVMVNFNYA